MFLVFKQYYMYFHTFFTYTYFQKIQTMLLKQYYQTGLANNLNGWVWSKFPGYQGTELHILHTYVVPGTVLILVVPTTQEPTTPHRRNSNQS